jgi:hypothetical protein
VTWRPGPITVALFLALVSTPFAALSIRAVSTGTVNSPREPVEYLAAAGMALVAVLVAGLVAGALGGAIARYWPVAGLVTAVFVAWPVAIATLPFAAAVLGVTYEAVWICVDSCFPTIRDSELSSGIGAYLLSQFLEAFGPIEVAVLLWSSGTGSRGVGSPENGPGLGSPVRGVQLVDDRPGRLRQLAVRRPGGRRPDRRRGVGSCRCGRVNAVT